MKYVCVYDPDMSEYMYLSTDKQYQNLIGDGTLRGFRYAFRSVITIEESEKHAVTMSVWEIDAAAEEALDKFARVPDIYIKKPVNAYCEGELIDAIVYVLNPEKCDIPYELPQDPGCLFNSFSLADKAVSNQISEAFDYTWEKIRASETEEERAARPKLFEMKLNKEPFRKIQSGKKTIELRLFDEKRLQIREGDAIHFFMVGEPDQKLLVEVLKIHRFPSFKELYENLPLSKCGYESDDRAAADYRDMLAYYSEEEEKKYGVVGIEFRLVADFVKRRELLSWLNDNKEKDS